MKNNGIFGGPGSMGATDVNEDQTELLVVPKKVSEGGDALSDQARMAARMNLVKQAASFSRGGFSTKENKTSGSSSSSSALTAAENGVVDKVKEYVGSNTNTVMLVVGGVVAVGVLAMVLRKK
jgi:hypothetical protein